MTLVKECTITLMLRVVAQDRGRCSATLQGCVESGFVKILSIARTCVVALGGLWYSVASVASGAPPLFVLNSLEANVSVIDPVTWTETARIPTGKEPHHLYLTPDEKSIIVANALGDTLTFVDPRTAEVQRTLDEVRNLQERLDAAIQRWAELEDQAAALAASPADGAQRS